MLLLTEARAIVVELVGGTGVNVGMKAERHAESEIASANDCIVLYAVQDKGGAL